MARSARRLDAADPAESFSKASFRHDASGFMYRVSIQSGQYLLEFASAQAGVKGAKPLSYAVGSGTRAFSYLIEEDGYLYEAPVAYYAGSGSWDLAPGYGRYSYPYLTRPIVPGCLDCHASSVQAKPVTLNRYSQPPFLEGGVACERCHGSGETHVARMRAGDLRSGPGILNPAKLPAANRDSICAQCHLTGAVRVIRAGSDWQSFRPGDRLSDHVAVFVRAGKPETVTVTGHVENLAMSACRKGSGGRLWCGSCHDPHAVPAPAKAAAYYRAKCLACHSTEECGESRTVRLRTEDDCVRCHMPRAVAIDAQHLVLTDHSIPRRLRGSTGGLVLQSDAELIPFDGGPASHRDLALAYAIAAAGKTGGPDRARALTLLQTAAVAYPNDPEVLVSLAEIDRLDGKDDLARPLYERALALEPGQVTASVGLGGVAMEQGRFDEAISLWTEALSGNAGLELVRLNLSLALWKSGRGDAAEANLKQALKINPAFTPARALLGQIAGANRH
jgi:hypothetical protein